MKKMYEVYVDSSYDWHTTVNGKGVGEIILVFPDKIVREKRELSVVGLKQLNNRFELLAIEEALKKIGWRRKNFIIYSDSRVAVNWACNLHVQWIRREYNKAGLILDKDEK